MALINVQVNAFWRLSGAQGQSAGRFISSLTPTTAALGSLSQYIQQDIVLGTTISEYLLSYANLSSPQLIAMVATAPVRVNFAGQSAGLSAASASQMTFKDMFIMMNVSGGLPSAIHFANSGTDSSTITILLAG